MTAHANPSIGKSTRTSEDAGQLTYNTFVFDLAAAGGYRPAALALDDTVLIGEVPAGEKLVPHLCRIDIPQLDSNGAPTGDYSIGAGTDDDALKGTAASETAVTLFGEDLILTNEIGDRDAATPVYLKILAASATVPTTGKVKAFLVSRPWDFAIDGA